MGLNPLEQPGTEHMFRKPETLRFTGISPRALGRAQVGFCLQAVRRAGKPSAYKTKLVLTLSFLPSVTPLAPVSCAIVHTGVCWALR